MFLITGASGQLGSELHRLLDGRAFFASSADLDITDKQAVESFLKQYKPEVIINCAAYTAVDKAESDEVAARKVNVDGVKNLASGGMPLIHISTDYVFDGMSCRPYVEADAPNPQTVYGKTKRAGELQALKNAQTLIILRTSWLYSSFGSNFVKTMLRLGAEKKSLNVVFDQIGTPTYAKDLGSVVIELLPRLKTGMKEIYHFSNEGTASWYDFARKIMELGRRPCEVLPIESKDYPTPAVRPHFSVLNKSRIKHDFGIKIRHWEDALRECMNELEK